MPNNEFGDFQTPIDLAMQCLRVLQLPQRARVLEPTCGRGSFLEAAARLSPSSERYGLDINEEYIAEASRWGTVKQGNIFTTALPDVAAWISDSPLFIIGNPPWITAAELRRMDSSNIPVKKNFKRSQGLEALLGSSNFDVCEYIMIKILREFSHDPCIVAMLCKTHIARKVMEYAYTQGLPISEASLYRIDAAAWFGAGVDACWFVIKVDPARTPQYSITLYADVFSLEAEPTGRCGIVHSRMVADIDKYADVCQADGISPYTWRSGLKHDAASVFELMAAPEPTTASGHVLDCEPEYIFPLLKSTDIFRGRQHDLRKWVIVPQKDYGAETAHLATSAPKLWKYLELHAEKLDARRSSIYKNRPRFSVFGHGQYTFSPYKVAISGLHKQPIFRLVTPIDGRPVVLDDTCYFLPFDDPTEALVVTSILNSPECRALIDALVFWDAKRPITKKLLTRLDLNRLAHDHEAIIAAAAAHAKECALSFNPAHARRLLGRLGQPAEAELSLF